MENGMVLDVLTQHRSMVVTTQLAAAAAAAINTSLPYHQFCNKLLITLPGLLLLLLLLPLLAVLLVPCLLAAHSQNRRCCSDAFNHASQKRAIKLWKTEGSCIPGIKYIYAPWPWHYDTSVRLALYVAACCAAATKTVACHCAG